MGCLLTTAWLHSCAALQTLRALTWKPCCTRCAIPIIDLTINSNSNNMVIIKRSLSYTHTAWPHPKLYIPDVGSQLPHHSDQPCCVYVSSSGWLRQTAVWSQLSSICGPSDSAYKLVKLFRHNAKSASCAAAEREVHQHDFTCLQTVPTCRVCNACTLLSAVQLCS